MDVLFAVMLVVTVVVVFGGSALVQARWRKTLDTPPFTYAGPERRSTVYVRPGKVPRPRDKWDMPEEVSA